MRTAPAWNSQYVRLFTRNRRLATRSTTASQYLGHYIRFQPRSSLIYRCQSSLATGTSNDAETQAQSEIWRKRPELKTSGLFQYPRTGDHGKLSVVEFIEKYEEEVMIGSTLTQETRIAGRVSSIRTAGSSLIFVDVLEQPGDSKLQVVVNRGNLRKLEEQAKSIFKNHSKTLRRGDVISVIGHPHRTKSKELSILALDLPQILSPCFHQIPEPAFGEDSDWANDKHVEMLSRPDVISTLVTRSKVVSQIQTFLTNHNFIQVQTPVLAAAAGGAIARPFETTATEFSDRKLALRIAPELWLKRLIIGGMSKVFEIGQVFRNEGLDKTHNPEFSTCEFYAVHWNLKQLQTETQAMLLSVVDRVGRDSVDSNFLESLHPNSTDPWPEIDFIPALNSALGQPLPDLASPNARQHLLDIFQAKSLPLPSKPTLPRLLDKLSGIYLEPHCKNATWITNIPECLSPLAKSYVHPHAPNSQSVAARAELYVLNKELVNCYEEENSPFEQRRKFVEQQDLARLPGDSDGLEEAVSDEEAMKLDEDYLRALEWGLPPTGGWGMGIDRLVMMVTGKERIGDVLSFGNLRAVTRGAEKYTKQSVSDTE